MTLYVLSKNEIVPIATTTFSEQKVKEREHLQALLKRHPDVICPNTLIVAEEFGDWEKSRRRIDLLGIDKNANLVIIELKRTEDGGHMELQALRYAAMISTITFDKLVSTFSRYLDDNNDKGDARAIICEHLDRIESDDETLGQDTKIVLASAEFSKELTTSVLWLNDRGIDISCVRLKPYDYNGQVILDVQTIIPLPETEEYQIKLRDKFKQEREARESGKNISRYDITVNGRRYQNENNRNMVKILVSEVLKNGGLPQQVKEILPSATKLREFDGSLKKEQILKILKDEDTGGAMQKFQRFFWDEPFPFEGKTYILSNQWTGTDAVATAEKLAAKFPDLDIEFKKTETPGA